MERYELKPLNWRPGDNSEGEQWVSAFVSFELAATIYLPDATCKTFTVYAGGGKREFETLEAAKDYVWNKHVAHLAEWLTPRQDTP